MLGKANREIAQVAEGRLRPLIGRQAILLMVVALFLWLLRENIPAINLMDIWHNVRQVTLVQWTLAMGATAASFWAVGRYDQVLHGLMGTGISPKQARHSGLAAIAIAQFTGFGVLTSALVRWRLLPDLGLTRALALSLSVAGSFIAGWGVVAAIFVLFGGVNAFHLYPLAIGTLGLAMVGISILAWQPRWLPPLPGMGAVLTIIALTLIDTLFAGAAFYVLLPPDITLNPLVFLSVFLVSIGAGLIGATPGGLGPFELSLISLLPMIPADSVLASVLAFRIVYYLIPAMLGLFVLFQGPLPRPGGPRMKLLDPPSQPYLSPQMERAIWVSQRAENGLVRQGDFSVLALNGAPQLLAASVAQNIVMLADPINLASNHAVAINCLETVAKQRFRSPIIYKCSGRIAIAARLAGWQIIPIAREAWLVPSRFSDSGPKYRQLRRAIRKAENSGVTVIEGTRDLPLRAMAKLSDDWALNHGGERGFSMGIFKSDYVSCQRVFLAYQGQELIAFITLHETLNEWTLDLMRHQKKIADGTMHMLITHAINSAAALKCPRISLAAVPHTGGNDRPMVRRVRRHLLERTPSNGLVRFKQSFAPNWQTLYAAAPSNFGLVTGLLVIFWRINGKFQQRSKVTSCSL